MTQHTKFADLTKEEKIAHIEKQITALNAKLLDVVNDVVRTPAKKTVPLPAIGDTVSFLRGRNTATTEAVETIGTVVGIKPAGEKTRAQLKVQVGYGFDIEFVTLYPAQCTAVTDLAPATQE